MRYFAAVFVLVGVTVGCGHAAAPPAPTAAMRTEFHERIVPHVCAARSKLAELLGRAGTAPPPDGKSQDALQSAPASPESAVVDPYRAAAPATVMIISDHGMGTGVVVDPRGYVLTNWHVVEDGRKTDLLDTVSVAFGDLSPTGRMSKQEKHYEAAVVKRDPTRDLALLKIKDPPPKLASVRLASSAPRVGEKVTAIGNAGIGFLWAQKSCSVASIGERQHDLAQHAALDCTIIDPSLAATEASRAKAACEELKKKSSDILLRDVQGVAVETDCAITHGDSGGPLLNVNGEVVGLNQSVRADLTTVSFHVHVDEIRDFTSSFPVDPTPVLPDPYCDGGDTPTLEDLDADGTADTLVAVTRNAKGHVERMSLLIDLDQDDAQKARTGSDPFDAEVALVTDQDGTYIWYDADNDGVFEILLLDKNSDGLPEKAYRIDGSGVPKEDPSILPKHTFTDKFVKTAAQQIRLGRIATAIGAKRYGSAIVLGVTSRAPVVPDAVTGSGTQARAYDSDGDGHPDCMATRSSFSFGVVIDADQNSLGELKNGSAVPDLGKTKIDAEVSVVFGLTSTWASYDIDNDGKFDLALEDASARGDALFATSAYHVADMSPAPDQLGRRLFRASLVPSMPRVATAFRLFKLDYARDEGIESFPDLVPPKAEVEVVHAATKDIVDGMVVTAWAGAWTTTFVDVDHSTKLKKPATDEDVERALADNKFDAEVAVVRRGNADGGSAWVFYDTDNDGKLDLVLYSATEREVTQAYRVKGSTVTVDPTFATGRPLRTKGIFKNKAIAAKWKTIAKTVFKASSIEE